MKLSLRGTPKRYDSCVPVGRLWPSGDFSMGYRRVAGDARGRLDLRSEKRRIDDGDYCGLPENYEYLGRGRVIRREPGMSASERAACDAFHRNVNAGGEGEAPLTLANARNSHTGIFCGYPVSLALSLAGWLALILPRGHRPQYGLKGITGYGKKMVRSAATLIERWATRRRTTFCTISMPDLPQAQRVRLAEIWPEYLRQLIQFLARRLERQGLPPAICSVSEVQPKRLADGGSAYLHLHLIWPNHRAKCGSWAVSALEVRAWSEAFLKRNEIFPDGAWVRCNVQPVQKTASGYLSKYMSKGGSDVAAMAQDLGWEAIPRQWWNMSKVARDMVKGELRHGDAVGRLILATVDGIFSGQLPFADCLWALHEVMLDIDGVPRGVGWRGAMKDGYRKDLIQMLDAIPVAS